MRLDYYVKSLIFMQKNDFAMAESFSLPTPGSRETKSNAIPIPSISIPKGGGSLKGIDEKFEVNPISGSPSVSIPLPVMPARGFSPSLSLSYSTGAGNGIFGLGWMLSLGDISRRTDNGLPLYDDDSDSDVFVLSGQEDLVPRFQTDEQGNPFPDGEGGFQKDRERMPDGSLYCRYLPRTEGSFSRIEYIRDSDGSSWWKVTAKDNSVVFFGKTAEARLQDPADNRKVFRWLAEFAYDNMGNCIHYRYRKDESGGAIQVYPDQVFYGNRHTWYPGQDWPQETDYLYANVFDYGQYDLECDRESPSGPWMPRADIFSNRRPGFEVRTGLICRNLLVYSTMDGIPGGKALLGSIHFEYDESPAVSLLVSATESAFRKDSEGRYSRKTLPSTIFHYSEHSWNSAVHSTEEVVFNDHCRFFDLYHEGIPGILHEDPLTGEMLYQANLGEGRFETARIVSKRPPTGRWSLTDLGSDGRYQFADLTPSTGGFYEIDDPARFEAGGDEAIRPFVPFERFPTLENTQAVRMVDLNGDGRAEMLISSDSLFIWYPSEGRKGFSEANVSPMFVDPDDVPEIVFLDATQGIFLADMTGDGLVDIVRIRHAEVSYYPNLGYGRFGRKVVMGNAPLLGPAAEFNPTLVRLADIDGTGTADLVFLGGGGFRCWLNRCGRDYSEKPFEILDVPAVDSLSDLTLCDLLGTGLSCLVWTSLLPSRAGRALRYIDLTASRKPYLMTGYANSMGKEVTMEYASSTRFFLEDKASGEAWNTRLGFPVQCLVKTEVLDRISSLRFVTTYRYRDGYFDHREREFRGFGMVEQTDTETFEQWEKTDGNVIDRQLYQDPVVTRTWVYVGNGKILPDDVTFRTVGEDTFEGWDNMTPDEREEACRAMRGMVYRSEVFLSGHTEPCGLSISSAIVRMLQPKGQNSHAVFQSIERQRLAKIFEDNPADFRLVQSLNLAFDKYGNVLRAAQIAYPRNTADPSAPEAVSQIQSRSIITYSRSEYSDDLVTGETYLLRVNTGSFAYSLEDLPRTGTLYTPEDFAPDRIQDRLHLEGGAQTLWLDANLKDVLPWKKISFPLISADSYQLAFTPATLSDVYGGKVTEEMLLEGKYVRLPDNRVDRAACGGWWIPSGRAVLLKEGESAGDARKRFFVPIAYCDQFGETTGVHYSGDTWMIVSATENPFGETVSIQQFDPFTLQPTLLRDINGNLSAAVYDETGMPKAMALMGKGDEADHLDGIFPGTSDDEDALIRQFFRATEWSAVESLAKKLLGGATERYLADYHAWTREGKPACTATITRERHFKDDPDSPIQITISYSNGLGDVILSKNQAEPDPADPSGAIRWVGNGRTVVNNKGNVVMQYEPYFSITPSFDSAREIVERGVTPVLHYDALDRNVRTDYPDGSFDKVEIHSWSVRTFDTGDTVKDSEWYRKRSALDISNQRYNAAMKSEIYQGTPVTVHFDPLGRPVCTDDAGRFTVAEQDVPGNLLSITDPRGIIVQRFRYDLLGRPLYTEGPDNGRRWVFQDADGSPVRGWNDRGQRTEYRYDRLRRLVSVRVVTEEIQEGEKRYDHIITLNRYAEDLLQEQTADSLRARNLLGKPVDSWDSGGKTHVDAYDFKGNPLEVIRCLPSDVDGTVDWREGKRENALETESFSIRKGYDALGRIAWQRLPDGTVVTSVYNEGGLLSSQAVALPGRQKEETVIRRMTYNEKRQRSHIEYGNGVVTDYTFDPETFRVDSVRSRRSNGTVLQAKRYFYDAAGKLSHITDESGDVHYSDNRKVNGDSDYTYDLHGRLVKANGRERAFAVDRDRNDRYSDYSFKDEFTGELAISVRPYSEEFDYDSSGNILFIKHTSEGNSWRRDYRYSDRNNRLLSTTVGDYTYNYHYHPRHGFLEAMPHLSSISWNYADQMVHTSRQVRADGGIPETTYYQYDGSGERFRKVTKSAAHGAVPVILEERIYLGGFEIFRKHAGADKGLERMTISLSDGENTYLMIDQRNDVDDGTDKTIFRYQLHDHLGSASIEVDKAGVLISLEEFTPYGDTAYLAWNKSVKAAAKRYRYTGMERDEESGLSYHHARYYIPWLGRWLSPDPIGIDGGLNLYCYCGNDPVGRLDPKGTSPWLGIIGGALETVAGIVTVASGVGAPAGVFMYVHGLDLLTTSIYEAISDEPTPSLFVRFFQSLFLLLGMNQQDAYLAAVLTDTAIDMVVNVSSAIYSASRAGTVANGMRNADNARKAGETARKLAPNGKRSLARPPRRHRKTQQRPKSSNPAPPPAPSPSSGVSSTSRSQAALSAVTNAGRTVGKIASSPQATVVGIDLAAWSFSETDRNSSAAVNPVAFKPYLDWPINYFAPTEPASVLKLEETQEATSEEEKTEGKKEEKKKRHTHKHRTKAKPKMEVFVFEESVIGLNDGDAPGTPGPGGPRPGKETPTPESIHCPDGSWEYVPINLNLGYCRMVAPVFNYN